MIKHLDVAWFKLRDGGSALSFKHCMNCSRFKTLFSVFANRITYTTSLEIFFFHFEKEECVGIFGYIIGTDTSWMVLLICMCLLTCGTQTKLSLDYRSYLT